MADRYVYDPKWPESAAQIKKELSSSFKKILGPKLESMGFSCKGGVYYRAHGSIYQAVGIKNNKYNAGILLKVLPYWSNDFIQFLYRVSPNHKATYTIFETDHMILNGRGHYVDNKLDRKMYAKDLSEFVLIAYQGFEEYYFETLETTKDENSFLHLYDGSPAKYKCVFLWQPNQEIVLYEAYKRGSIEELAKLYQQYYTSKTKYWKESKKKAIAGKIMEALLSGNMDFIKEFHDYEAQKMKKFFYDGWKLNFTDS